MIDRAVMEQRKNRNRYYFNGRTAAADYCRLRLKRNGFSNDPFLITTEFENGTTAIRLRNNGNLMVETRRK